MKRVAHRVREDKVLRLGQRTRGLRVASSPRAFLTYDGGLWTAANYSGSGDWLDEINSNDATNSGAKFLGSAGDPPAFVFFPGRQNNRMDAPTATYDWTGVDATFVALVHMSTTTGAQHFFSQWANAGASRCFRLVMLSGGAVRLQAYDNNTVIATLDSTTTLSVDTWTWIRVDLDGSNGSGASEADFYFASYGGESEIADPTSISWGSAETDTSTELTGTNLQDVTRQFVVGSADRGAEGADDTSTWLDSGCVAYAGAWDGAFSGDPDVVFDPSNGTIASDHTTVTSDGIVWTRDISTGGQQCTIREPGSSKWVVGGDDHLDVGEVALFDVGTDDFTVFFWGRVHGDGADHVNHILASKQQGIAGGDIGYSMLIANDGGTARTNFVVSDGVTTKAGFVNVGDHSAITMGELQLLGIRRTGDQMSVYSTGAGWVDSVDGTGVDALDLDAASESLMFAAVDDDAVSDWLDGEIYGVRHWPDYAVTAAETAVFESEYGIS